MANAPVTHVQDHENNDGTGITQISFYMKTFIKAFFLFLLFNSYCAFTQNTSIPVFHTTDPRKLSEHITKGITNDSDKIVAIHKWITYNIKYDVKKWLNFNYDPVPLNKVLKKHKANCLGYSELFNALCLNAGIKSVQVNGYVKDMNVDIVDNFYLDEHAWNAVYLNNRWKYVDDTWDAGYIKYSKITFWGHIVKFVTSGKVVIIKYKPHFIKDPGDFYFLKSDTYYKRDHLSLNPLWQFSSPSLTIKQFKSDSTYYFGLEPAFNDNRKYDTLDNKERMRYSASDENAKTISDGFEGNKFNSRNSYCLAKGWYAIADNEFAKIAPESVNKVEQSELCDTVISCSQFAVAAYDTNAVMLQRQKKELLTNSIIKKNSLIQENNKLIRSTKYALRNLNNGIALSKKNVKYAKKMVKTYKNKLKKLKKSKSFYKKKYAKKPMLNDSLNYYFNVLFTNDSIAMQQDSIKQSLGNQDTFYAGLLKNFSSYSVGSIRFISIENMLQELRYEYYDDFDYEVKTLRNTLVYNKYDNDLLLFSDSIFQIKLLYYGLKNIKSKMYRQARFFRFKALSLTQLKGSCVNEGNITEQYEENLQQMEKDVELFSSDIKIWIKRYNELKSYCRKQRSMTTRELKSYIDEKATEYGFYAVRGGYIKHHYTALINNNKFHIRKTNELKRKAEKLKKKIEN
jgi:hypothetical protein